MLTLNELENLILDNTVDLSVYERYYQKNEKSPEIDVIVYELSSLDTNILTFGEIVDKMEMDLEYDPAYLAVLDSIYPYWVDYEALKNREDNILNWTSSDNWELNYKVSLAQYLIENGVVVMHGASIYLWKDYPLSQSDKHIVGVYNIQEDSWGEFLGTFVDNEQKTGYIADVLFSDGTSRIVRVEGSLGSMLNNII